MGDIFRAVESGAQEVGMIDGYFEHVPSVWHKEILFALSRGVRVVGGGSMGALRAAETHTFGTEGVGTIFRWYRDGYIEHDDEVAVAHAPQSEGWRPSSEALVNLRWGLRRACSLNIVSDRERDALLDHQRRLFYPERSWNSVLESARNGIVRPLALKRLERFVRDTRPDLKRIDALKVLSRLAKTRGRVRAVSRPGFVFQPTKYWRLLMEHESSVHGADYDGQRVEVTAEDLFRHVATSDSQREEILLQAQTLAAGGQASLPQPIIAKVLQRGNRLNHTIKTLVSKRRWLRRSGYDSSAFHDNPRLLAHTARWYRKRFGRTLQAASEAARLGFPSETDFRDEVVRQFLFENKPS